MTATIPSTPTDFARLAELRAGAAGNAAGVTPEVARQFEALFVQMMLQSMRDAGAAFGDGSDTTYREMFDQQIALELTRGKGIGLAEMLTRQLSPAGQPPAAETPPIETGSAPDPFPGQASWQDWRPATPEDFIRDVWPHARRAGEALGVDPRALVAQAALETGWGRRLTRTDNGMSANNPFNIKADSRWQGERVSVRTIEFESGLPRPQTAAFRAYPDLGSAFDDYVRFLRENPRYTEALRHGAEPGRFADSLQAAGYATDPAYADKLRSILGGNRLGAALGALQGPAGLPGERA